MLSTVRTKTEKLKFSNSSGLKSVFEKLRFRDGLVWTVDLTVTQISHNSLSPGKPLVTNPDLLPLWYARIAFVFLYELT